ncbi:MAG: acyl carrier protein [Natronohydrobacter sp.]|nr:acyl carrier protein [Natronohydrobacter sp.]
METLALIQSVLVDVTKQDVPTLEPEMDLVEDLDLDSILFVQFLLALEDHVDNLEFNQETLTEARLNIVGDLVGFVESARAQAA